MEPSQNARPENSSSKNGGVNNNDGANVEDLWANQFGVSRNELKFLMSNYGKKSVQRLKDFGGIDELCDKLRTSATNGLSDSSLLMKIRQETFGSNKLPTEDPIPFRVFFFEASKDFVLFMLTVVAILSIATYFIKSSIQISDGGHGWIDGIAILLCVLAITFINAFNDYSRDRRFRSLRTRLVHDKEFSVVRNDIVQEIPVEEILVGDVCLLKAGDRIPADGILIQGTNLTIDESAMTGISDLVWKDDVRDVLLLSGTHVMNGIGRMVVTAVGVHSQAGIHLLVQYTHEDYTYRRTENSLQSHRNEISDHMFPTERPSNEAEDHNSYLQKKLSRVAVKVSYFASAMVLVVVTILIIRFSVTKYFFLEEEFDAAQFLTSVMHFIFIGVDILIIGIPEGLPMAVAIGLTYTVKQMLKDNCLVRHINSCEKMGNATSICCDKTGVLTTNRMAVVQAFISQVHWRTVPQFELLPKPVGKLISESIAYNCSYISNITPSYGLGSLPTYVGNRTECALLRFSLNLDQDYHKLRKEIPEEDLVHVYPFDSEKKIMSTVINTSRGYRIFTKGATEIILSKCSQYYAKDNTIKPMTKNDLQTFLYTVNNPMANDGLRTIAMAYRDTSSKERWNDEDSVIRNMILLCILGIEDPIRPEAPLAIRECQKAGITVRMLTGDNIYTARAIAIKCGILEINDDNFVLESKDFNNRIRVKHGVVDQKLMDQIWPKLRVLARCSSKDKYTLVKGILESNVNDASEVVAAMGRESKDALVLRKTDIGFGLGMIGTDIAKETCDIILLDDGFHSVFRALLWGRNLYDNFCKFLQFQLTICLTAVALTVVTAFAFDKSPFATIQILYTNITMNLFASMALATEKPSEALIHRPPYGRNYPIITKKIILNILGHSFYQLCILFIIIFYGERIFRIPSARFGDVTKETATQHFTIVFNIFYLCNLFNLLNCTKINNQRNIFKGIFGNSFFCFVWVSLFISQFIIVEYLSGIFLTQSLTRNQWIWCLFISATVLLWHQVILTIQIKCPRYLREDQDYIKPEERMGKHRVCFIPMSRPKQLWYNALKQARLKLKIINMLKNTKKEESVELEEMNSEEPKVDEAAPKSIQR